jgi:glycine/D-amino acid oxidase-like deaminating enzyme/nitrite reductase/ring-hydroxylating ferredoxin subunit
MLEAPGRTTVCTMTSTTESSTMKSLWLDSSQTTPGYVRPEVIGDQFQAGRRFDIVVAGAGLTGLTTALLFARSGLSVAVIEAREVGAVTTGNTTAKLSLLQGTRLSSILRHHSLRVGQAYVEANREGMEWLLRYCDDHGVPAQRRDAYTYAGTPEGTRKVERELRAARRLGLDVEMVDADELPYPTYGAVRLAGQAQVNPMDVLAELANDVQAHGGVIYEHTRLTAAKAGDPTLVVTSRGSLRAGKLILATGIPVLDRGLYFAKVVPQRSYALAFTVPGPVPEGMYISADSPTRSLRTAPIDGGQRLLIGGNGHIGGRSPSPKAAVNDLHHWTLKNFPGAERTHSWSAQDYEPVGRIPYVGWLPRGRGRIFLATGYDKWGMANAVAAALTLSADILGGHLPWARTLHHRVTSPADVGSLIGANASVVVHLVRGYWKALTSELPAVQPEGSGSVSHDGVHPVGVCRVGGATHRVSAVCTHLGGVLNWNDAELSWDCPLHGSRFTATGTRLEGPAVRDLKRLG